MRSIQYGTLIIKASFIKLHADGRVRMMPIIVSRVHVSRDEAIAMCKEHKKQANINDPSQHYDYTWQVENEDWNKSDIE